MEEGVAWEDAVGIGNKTYLRWEFVRVGKKEARKDEEVTKGSVKEPATKVMMNRRS